MERVTVFVDDAVRGTLPDVCVKDGTPTTDRLLVRDELGDRASLGVAWLLLLLGPLGWLGLLVMLAARGGRAEVLAVQVPMSEGAYQRLRAARRLGRGALGVGAIAFVAAVMSLPAFAGDASDLGGRALALTGVAGLVGAIIARFIADRRVNATTVGVDLDASRRWVTLSRVHESFAAACEARTEQHHQRT